MCLLIRGGGADIHVDVPVIGLCNLILYTLFSYVFGRSAEVQLLQQRATGPRVEEKGKPREAVPS